MTLWRILIRMITQPTSQMTCEVKWKIFIYETVERKWRQRKVHRIFYTDIYTMKHLLLVACLLCDGRIYWTGWLVTMTVTVCGLEGAGSKSDECIISYFTRPKREKIIILKSPYIHLSTTHTLRHLYNTYEVIYVCMYVIPATWLTALLLVIHCRRFNGLSTKKWLSVV